MSGYSSTCPCPNCGKEAELYEDHKPFPRADCTCNYCGFYTWTQAGYLDLESLNNNREYVELEPLTELPEQDKDLL